MTQWNTAVGSFGFHCCHVDVLFMVKEDSDRDSIPCGKLLNPHWKWTCLMLSTLIVLCVSIFFVPELHENLSIDLKTGVAFFSILKNFDKTPDCFLFLLCLRTFQMHVLCSESTNHKPNPLIGCLEISNSFTSDFLCSLHWPWCYVPQVLQSQLEYIQKLELEKGASSSRSASTLVDAQTTESTSDATSETNV